MLRTVVVSTLAFAAGAPLLLGQDPPREEGAGVTQEQPPAPSASAQKEAPGAEEETLYELNLGLYQNVEREHSGFTQVIPLYTYKYDRREDSTDLLIWPLLTGFHSDSNSDLMFSFPILTFSGTYREPDATMEQFVSLPVMTMHQSIVRKDGNEASTWFSLPALTFLRTERIRQADATYDYSLHSTFPLFQRRNLDLSYTDSAGVPRSARIHRWALTPLSLKDELDVHTFRDSHWNEDHETQFAFVWNLSLLNYHVRHNRSFPGANLSEYEFTIPDDYDANPIRPDMLAPASQTRPITHFGLIDPLFSVESNSDDYFRFELSPLVSHRIRGDEKEWHIVPLFTTFAEDGVRLDPLKSFHKMFPISYYDENRGRAEILWPLFLYEQQDDLQIERYRMRLLFDYHRRGTYRSLDLVEGLLYDHKWGKSRRRVNVLGGLLFSEEERPEEEVSHWEILRGLIYGEEETPDASYIKVLMLRFKVRDKAEERERSNR